MKKSICLAVSLLALNLTPAFGQTLPLTPPEPLTADSASQPAADNAQQRLLNIIKAANPPQKPAPELTKFNLDFPGGTPKELVAAIEKATKKPLNAIIPTENADLQMPPLKMNDVVVSQLFTALQVASRKTVAVSTGTFGNSYSMQNTSYGFNTADSPVSDASIWYFHAEKPSLPPVSAARLPKNLPVLYAGRLLESRLHSGRHHHRRSNRLENGGRDSGAGFELPQGNQAADCFWRTGQVEYHRKCAGIASRVANHPK